MKQRLTYEDYQRLYLKKLYRDIPTEYSRPSHPEISGYILIQTYPGCSKQVGHFEPYTSGEFSNYPHIWKPVYHKQVAREKKINEILGEN